jgi:hypothetical protein
VKESVFLSLVTTFPCPSTVFQNCPWIHDVRPRMIAAIVKDLRLFILLNVSFLNSDTDKDRKKNYLLHVDKNI